MASIMRSRVIFVGIKDILTLGQLYIRRQELGGHILLFVRHRKKIGGQVPMPADFFREAKVVAV